MQSYIDKTLKYHSPKNHQSLKNSQHNKPNQYSNHDTDSIVTPFKLSLSQLKQKNQFIFTHPKLNPHKIQSQEQESLRNTAKTCKSAYQNPQKHQGKKNSYFPSSLNLPFSPKSERSHYQRSDAQYQPESQFTILTNQQFQLKLIKDPFFRMKIRAYYQQNKQNNKIKTFNKGQENQKKKLQRERSLRNLKNLHQQLINEKMSIFQQHLKPKDNQRKTTN